MNDDKRTRPDDKASQASGRYSGTDQQQAHNGGRQQGDPATKKPDKAGYRGDRGPGGGKVDGDAPRGSGSDDKS